MTRGHARNLPNLQAVGQLTHLASLRSGLQLQKTGIPNVVFGFAAMHDAVWLVAFCGIVMACLIWCGIGETEAPLEPEASLHFTCLECKSACLLPLLLGESKLENHHWLLVGLSSKWLLIDKSAWSLMLWQSQHWRLWVWILLIFGHCGLLLLIASGWRIQCNAWFDCIDGLRLVNACLIWVAIGELEATFTALHWPSLDMIWYEMRWYDIYYEPRLSTFQAPTTL